MGCYFINIPNSNKAMLLRVCDGVLNINIGHGTRLVYSGSSVNIIYCNIIVDLKYCDCQKFDKLIENIKSDTRDEEIDQYIISECIRISNIVNTLNKQIYTYILFDESDYLALKLKNSLDHIECELYDHFSNGKSDYYIGGLGYRFSIDDEVVQMIISGEITTDDVYLSICTQIYKAFNICMIKSAKKLNYFLGKKT